MVRVHIALGRCDVAVHRDRDVADEVLRVAHRTLEAHGDVEEPCDGAAVDAAVVHLRIRVELLAEQLAVEPVERAAAAEDALADRLAGAQALDFHGERGELAGQFGGGGIGHAVLPRGATRRIDARRRPWRRAMPRRRGVNGRPRGPRSIMSEAAVPPKTASHE